MVPLCCLFYLTINLLSLGLSVAVSICRQGSKVDLRDLLALSVEAAVQGGKEVSTINSYVSLC